MTRSDFGREVIAVSDCCVFCGDRRDPLSEEHVIPFGLNGQWVLENASCRRCADITSSFEREVLRNQLLMARAALGMRTRRKNERPTAFPLHVRGRGVIQVPISEHQPVLYLPFFAPPSEYDGRPATKGITPHRDAQFIMIGGLRFDELNHKYGRDNWAYRLTFDALALPRLIGKIAHCLAVARFGFDGFTSYVCEAVMKDPDEIGRWVGNLPGPPRNSNSPTLHAWSLFANRTNNVGAFIRMFAQFDAPEYFVIVGEVNERGRAHAKGRAS